MLREATAGSGGVCGASLVDECFKAHLAAQVGSREAPGRHGGMGAREAQGTRSQEAPNGYIHALPGRGKAIGSGREGGGNGG